MVIKMNKKIISLFFILFLTGCSNQTTYNLKINDNQIKETINVALPDTDYERALKLNNLFDILPYQITDPAGKDVIEYIKTNDLRVSDELDATYTKKITKKNLKLSHDFTLYKYKDALIPRRCFEKIYFDETDDYYVINGYNQFKCVLDEETSVSIQTNYRVIETNADKVAGNKYTWIYNQENKDNHELYIQFSKTNKRKYINYPIVLGIMIILIILLGIKTIFWIIKSLKKLRDNST